MNRNRRPIGLGRKLLVFVLLTVVVSAAAGFLRWDISRPAEVARVYGGAVAVDDGCRFTASIEEIGFQLENALGKYRLVRVSFDNSRGTTAIVLSPDADEISARIEGDMVVAGILNLQSADPTLWDSLDEPMRKALAYPDSIEPGQRTRDAGYVYAWFPADKLKALPDAFTLTIASVTEPIVLRRTATAKR